MEIEKENIYRSKNSKWVVDRWHVPGGCEYDLATNMTFFFDEKEKAEAYAKHWEMPPEMARVYPISIHDQAMTNIARGYAHYKKRFWSDFHPTDVPKEMKRFLKMRFPDDE